MITRVFHLLNDNVVAFDETNKMLDIYCGKHAKVVDKIMADATGSTRFFMQQFTTPISKEAFQDKSIFATIKKRG